jgi:transcriptional regulator with GAF, ATPase, and Fis domain
MDNKQQLSFEQILNATVHMLRETWKAGLCAFLQMDDLGKLRLRSADGTNEKPDQVSVDAKTGAFARCCADNQIVEVTDSQGLGTLTQSLRISIKPGEKYVVVPVSGESRVIGVLVMGPFPAGTELLKREPELRSAGALCAVLSAHWRLYEWMDSIVPQLNHSLRTPLTAVQGSIGMVLGGVFGQVGNDVKEMLEMAQKGCERTVRAIEDYLNTQNPSKK